MPREKNIEWAFWLSVPSCTRAYNTNIKVCFLAGLHRLGSRAANIRYYLVEFDFQSCRAACPAVPSYSLLLPSSYFAAIKIVIPADGTEGFKPVVDACDCKTYFRATYLSDTDILSNNLSVVQSISVIQFLCAEVKVTAAYMSKRLIL